MQSMGKPQYIQDIVEHLKDVTYPVTGKQFMVACNNMSDIADQQKDWVKKNIDPNKTYNTPDEIRQALQI